MKEIYATPPEIAQKARRRIAAIEQTRCNPFRVRRQTGIPMDAKTTNYTGWQSDVIVD